MPSMRPAPRALSAARAAVGGGLALLVTVATLAVPDGPAGAAGPAAAAPSTAAPSTAAPSTVAPAAPAAGDARAARARLALQIADLTDRLGAGEARLVDAEFRQKEAAAALAAVQTHIAARAVAMYMLGQSLNGAALAAPSVYADVAQRKQLQLVTQWKEARRAAAAEQATADQEAAALRATSAQLDAARRALDQAVAAQDAERQREQDAQAAALKAADEARARAMAAAAAAAASSGSSGPGGGALTPQHRVATQNQLALMQKWPFGPLPAGSTLPSGLRATGQTVAGVASWYGPGFDGQSTASGAIYDQEGWTCASPDLPLGTFLVVTNGTRRVLLLVNDRGPYVPGRVLDLSHAAATALGYTGLANVSAEVVQPGGNDTTGRVILP